MAEPTAFEQIRAKILAGELGTLAEQVLFLVHQDSKYSQYGSEKMSDSEAAERLKRDQINISFQTFDCVHQRELSAVARAGGEEIPVMQYGINTKIIGRGFHTGTSHFKWNGSWEGLDDQMKRDAAVLKEMGFNINYREYQPK